METKVYDLDRDHPDREKIGYAAEVIRNGGTVVFPTETVYGLGANGLDGEAAEKIFVAKGRPQDNPLIIHVADKNIERYVEGMTDRIRALMERFWPGPLTIIMKKSPLIPGVITAGLDSVGIRMPKNRIANELIKEAGVPIAAPSANISGRPSPTTVEHTIHDLYGKVDVILGGGKTNVGLESTIIDMTGRPTILRPGGVTLEDLTGVLGEVDVDPTVRKKPSPNLRPKAPGMKYRHYAPKADMYVINGSPERAAEKITELCDQSIGLGKKVGIMATDQTLNLYRSGDVVSMGDRNAPRSIASSMFNILREFDEKGVDIIFAEGISEKGIGFAIMNRMRKSAGFNIINV